MELRQLKYFIGIVDAGSMMQASTRLHIAQPALSQQVAKLESELGIELLSRGPRGVVPTEAGSALYRHAEIVLKLVGESADVIRRTKQSTIGRVRLGMPPYLAQLLAAPLVTRLRTTSPGVSIEIHEHFSLEQVLQLQQDEVDVSLLTDDAPSHPSVIDEPLLREALMFIRARRGAPGPLPETVHLFDAILQPQVMSAQPGYRARLAAVLAGSGRSIETAAEAKAAQTVLDLVANGVGVCLLPHSALRAHARAAELEFCTLVPTIERRIWFGYTHLYPMTQATRRVCDTLVEMLREQIEAGLWLGARLDAPARTQPAGAGAPERGA